MDPLDLPHLAVGRPRYDPHPPHSQFFDSDYYRQTPIHPHHHSAFHPPPPPSPLLRHYPEDRGRHPDDGRLRFPYPNHPDPFPPPPATIARAPDRAVLPDGRPLARPARAIRSEPFPGESWEGGAFDDRLRFVDERPDLIRLQLEQQARQGLAASLYRGNSYTSEDLGPPVSGRKRVRWVQDRNLEEDFGARGQRRLELLEGNSSRRREFHFEPLSPDASLAEAPVSPAVGLRNCFVPERGEEAGYVMERRLPPPPSVRPSGYSYSGREVSERDENMVFEDRGRVTNYSVRENHFRGSRGKRRMPSEEYEYNAGRSPMKRSHQRPSALSRIQSGISVWNRIEEKPSSPAPPPPLPFSPTRYFDEHQSEVVDLSFKSNALVAKVVTPPSPSVPGAEGKDPEVRAPKKRVIKKKKQVKKGETVAVSITPALAGSKAKERGPKRHASSSPHQVSKSTAASSMKSANDANRQACSKKAAERTSVSCIRPADDADPRSCPKRVMKMVPVGKNAIKRADKTASCGEEETKKCKNTIVSEGRCTNDNSLERCQSGFTDAAESVEKSAEVQYEMAGNLVEDGGSEDIRDKEYLVLDERNDQNCASLVPDMGVVKDASSLHLTLRQAVIMASHDNSAVEESPKSGNNEAHEGPSNQVMNVVDDCENTMCPDNDFGTCSTEDFSSSALGGNGQVTSTFGGDTHKGKNVTSKSQREETRHVKVQMVTNEFETSEEKTVSGSASLPLHVQGISCHSPVRVKDKASDGCQPDGAVDDKNDCLILLDSQRPPQSYHLSPGKDGSAVSNLFETLPGLSKVDSLAMMSEAHDFMHCTDAEQSCPLLLDGKNSTFSNNDDSMNQNEKSSIKDKSSLAFEASLFPGAEEDSKLEILISHQTMPEKTRCLASHETKKQKTMDSKVISGEEPKLQEKVLPGQVNLASSSKESVRLTHRAGHKTWHRNRFPSTALPSNTSLQFLGGSLLKQSPKKLGRLQSSSYVRKGNCLIRNPATNAHPPQLSHSQRCLSKTTEQTAKRRMNLEAKCDPNDSMACSNLSLERPKTPPLPLGNKVPNCTKDPSRDISHSVLENLISGLGVEGHIRSPDLPSGNNDNQNDLSTKRSETVCATGVIYVKRKSNQLVAAPGPKFGDPSNQSLEKAQAVPSCTTSELYYRRTKNQLIRNASSSNNQQKQDIVIPTCSLSSNDQMISRISSLNNSAAIAFKKRQDRVLQKTNKLSKNSNVWTLGGEQSRAQGVMLLNRRKVLPYLFPWKRAINWKSYMCNTSAIRGRSLSFSSAFSRKLQLMRKRDTIYRLSKDGFSLRKAGVLSIGGSSLKWSRSIQRRAKKANEEATLAVAEADRKKRERRKWGSIHKSEKTGNCLPRKSTFGIQLQQGERIFRVGSARYRMDPSRRTLIRIPDEQSPSATGQQSREASQTSLVPKRLLIGNDEYIRIGNGNQLVRDPKKLIRILASEKVRWSLHTARLRLARKQQYCQFFTRFGKCNKNGRKCPYIHDPTKVAICTKFLKGSCSNTNCRLTHKVLPERMPDCSYFLRGLCTNTNCPYRHVNVNPSASICEGFLKGYCADGDECRRKHSYVCPLFEATGRCPQGSKCKLHHPKNRNKSKERKGSVVPSNTRKRYFGSNICEEVGEPLIVSTDNQGMEKAGDLFCSDGRFTDYISLSIGDDGCESFSVPDGSHPDPSESDHCDMQPDNLDALIKPIRIMKKTGFITASFNL